MSKRAEIRRKRRADMKLAESMVRNQLAPYRDIKSMDIKQISQKVGVDLTNLREWGEAKTHEIWQDAMEQANDIVWRCNNYMAFANILMMLFAVKYTFGNLKTVQKGMNNLIRNLNKAQDYIDKTGICESYEEIRKEYDLEDIEFEEFDLNELWNYKDKEVQTFCKVMGGQNGT